MVGIRLSRYNIHNVRHWGSELALRVIVQTNMDLGVLFEMKITGGVYTCHFLD